MARSAAGNNRQTRIRRRLEPAYPSLALVMHTFWYFVQMPIRFQPAPSRTNRPPPMYDTNPQRINLAAEGDDDDWAMRTYNGPVRCSLASAASGASTPSAPPDHVSPENTASKMSLMSIGSSS